MFPTGHSTALHLMFHLRNEGAYQPCHSMKRLNVNIKSDAVVSCGDVCCLAFPNPTPCLPSPAMPRSKSALWHSGHLLSTNAMKGCPPLMLLIGLFPLVGDCPTGDATSTHIPHVPDTPRVYWGSLMATGTKPSEVTNAGVGAPSSTQLPPVLAP